MASPKSEIANIKTSLRRTRSVKGVDYDIDVTSIKETKSGVEVLAIVRVNGKDVKFGKSESLQKFVIVNPPTLIQDNVDGDIINESLDEITGITTVTKYRHDPEYMLIQSLAETVSNVMSK